MDEIHLTHREVIDLVLTILEGVDFADDPSTGLRASWPAEMRDVCLDLLNRLYGDGGEPMK